MCPFASTMQLNNKALDLRDKKVRCNNIIDWRVRTACLSVCHPTSMHYEEPSTTNTAHCQSSGESLFI